MKVIAINGSARKDGNTAILINYALGELAKEGIQTELFQLAGKKVQGCKSCYKCFKNKDQHCGVTNDVINECIDKMIEADGIILGSPTYFADISSEMKALIDRSGLVSTANGNMFKRKLGASIAVARRAGSIYAFDSINHFFLYNEMIIPGSSYWNVGFGFDKGDVENDVEAIQIMKTLGVNMAWLLKKITA